MASSPIKSLVSKPVVDPLASLKPLYLDSDSSSASSSSSTTIPVQGSRKRYRRSPEMAHVYSSLDQMERELEMIKVKMLTCRSAHQKANINGHVERILEMCKEVKEEVAKKKVKLEKN
ncbi:unnamed protein product [Bursaphelenchus xylophilus]|uniref:(pine wood nematode) hypothetical protein n=1 Tax=Bursaphelenchus xylophilus TaxID=6326 RepID=A0A1I7SEY3_BURXY|nr:unnamed protein product [Bursaphelenchus xylophilus]CAG9113708.1 unnamed protein product [Bursaphelenchus xylophilus]